MALLTTHRWMKRVRRKRGSTLAKRRKGLLPLAVTQREKGSVSIQSQVSAFCIVGSFRKYLLDMLCFHVAQSVKNLPAVLETWGQFLGPEEPLEKEMATLSSILAWKIPWTEEPSRLQSICPKSRTRLGAIFFTSQELR